ncbi:putative lipoprotein [Cocos nucifera]|uniref:Putative lipoprotein n=1 Tax=Cocos nucifera TaxID=13894 RepID=A0A8K0NC09_COCNU|nr:putative lipoprotein [Cocos nucifera]
MTSHAQPMVAYPQAITTQNASNSKGSFVPVFVALAVIAVLSAIACFVGQVCARRYLRPKPRRDHAFHPIGDVESQFATSIPAAKPDACGGSQVETRTMGSEELMGETLKHDEIGGNKGEGGPSAK